MSDDVRRWLRAKRKDRLAVRVTLVGYRFTVFWREVNACANAELDAAEWRGLVAALEETASL